MIAMKLTFLLLLVVIRLPQSRQQCQKVLKGYRAADNTGAPVAYNDIEPNTSNCFVNSQGTLLQCPVGTVLNDGDIGPTHSVNVNDTDQVCKFFVWHRDSGTVTLRFPRDPSPPFNVSYIDIYTLSVPSAGIGSPGIISFFASTPVNTSIPVSAVTTQNCSFSSNTNTLSRNTYTVSLTTIMSISIRFQFPSTDMIDWLFISEIQLCERTPLSCESPTKSSSPPTPPPAITFSYPPPSGVTVTPDLSQPDSVSLTCSVASPPTDDYQYQWQWWKNGIQLNNDNRLTITHTTNPQSSSLQISGLQYSDEGEYMCRVQYTMCPDGVDCSVATPVTGSITLNLPAVIEAESSVTVFTGESTEAVLECEVYGYPRDSSSPVWTRGSDTLDSDRYTVTNVSLPAGSSISTTERVVSQLTITNVIISDSGDYTCSWQGNSTTITVTIVIGERTAEEAYNCACGGLVGGVSGLAVLLLISVSINILAMIYCIYHLRLKLTQYSRGDERGNVEQLYEQVDEKQHHSETVAMKKNEAYGQISSSSPINTTGL